jgi:hypothetical protein
MLFCQTPSFLPYLGTDQAGILSIKRFDGNGYLPISRLRTFISYEGAGTNK